MKRRIQIFGILIILIGISFTPLNQGISIRETYQPISSRDILYVGGTEPNNYTKIQDAIDNASDGDTVYVYDDSSPYYENVIVDKSINLIGEDRNTTIIDGNDKGDVITIKNTNYVKINSFTISNSTFSELEGSGIFITYSDDCIISNNCLIYNNRAGILVYMSCKNISIIDNIITDNKKGIVHFRIYSGELKNSIIKDNIITNNFLQGIWLDKPIDCKIIGNIIKHNGEGIAFWFTGGNNNVVERNIISNNFKGIQLFGHDVQSNTILYNEISNNIVGIHLYDCLGNLIQNNNFLFNLVDNIYEIDNNFYFQIRSNKWVNNYYSGRFGLLPKPIIGFKWLYFFPLDLDFIIPWIPLFDRNPVNKPYNIEV